MEAVSKIEKARPLDDGGRFLSEVMSPRQGLPDQGDVMRRRVTQAELEEGERQMREAYAQVAARGGRHPNFGSRR